MIYRNRAKFEPGIQAIIDERARVQDGLSRIPGVTAYPSDANYVMLRIANAGKVWQALYDRGVLVRDFSASPYLKDCLRVTIGSQSDNDAFLTALREVAMAAL